MPPVPIVLFDANLLYPFHLRNLLVQLAVNDIVAARWTDRIHDEWIRNIAAAGIAGRDRLLRTRDIMKRVLPSADVAGYEAAIEGLSLPDPDDRHVLAAAIAGGASVILTFNVRHFPTPILAAYGITCREPDGLLCELYNLDSEAVLASANEARLNLSRTGPGRAAFLEAIARQRLTLFAEQLRGGWMKQLGKNVL
jgi:predicted nucleic acid-binding protein